MKSTSPINHLIRAILNDDVSREDLRDMASGLEDTNPMDEALSAMDELLTQTVDADLAYGVELTEGEAMAREQSLAVFAKYGPEYTENRTVEGMEIA